MDFDNRKVYGDTSIADGLVVVVTPSCNEPISYSSEAETGSCLNHAWLLLPSSSYLVAQVITVAAVDTPRLNEKIG